jgi:hypothetical protein
MGQNRWTPRLSTKDHRTGEQGSAATNARLHQDLHKRITQQTRTRSQAAATGSAAIEDGQSGEERGTAAANGTRGHVWEANLQRSADGGVTTKEPEGTRYTVRCTPCRGALAVHTIFVVVLYQSPSRMQLAQFPASGDSGTATTRNGGTARSIRLARIPAHSHYSLLTAHGIIARGLLGAIALTTLPGYYSANPHGLTTERGGSRVRTLHPSTVSVHCEAKRLRNLRAASEARVAM